MLNLLEPFEEAPQDLIQRLKEPKSSDECYLVGIAFEKLGKFPSAEQMFRRALQQNMRHIPSLYGLALRAFQTGKEREAKTWLSRAIRFDPKAEENVVRFQKELRQTISAYQNACRWRISCLQELEKQKKAGLEGQFELAKLMFEQSQFVTAMPYFRALLKEEKYGRESAEYLSFALENIYHGEALIEKSLELAPEFINRADLFFNLAMVCQHDQRRADLALHFFYLASQEDADDPGLKFSLEQAALEVISESKRRTLPSPLLMFAHLYQGSTGVAKRYAEELLELGSEVLSTSLPERLWKDWLSVDTGKLGAFLNKHFVSR